MALQLKSAQEMVNSQRGEGLLSTKFEPCISSSSGIPPYQKKELLLTVKAVLSNSWYIREETGEGWFQLGSSCYNRTSMYLTTKLDTFHHHPHLFAA